MRPTKTKGTAENSAHNVRCGDVDWRTADPCMTDDYLTKIQDFAQQLDAIQALESEVWLVFIILHGLTFRFEPFNLSLDDRSESLRMDELIGKLSMDDRQQGFAQAEEEVACFSKGKPKPRNERSKPRSVQRSTDIKAAAEETPFPYKRYYCHEDGHKALDCPKKKADRKPKAKSQAKGFLTTSSDFLTAPAENEQVGKWYVDSCCSYYVTNEEENMVNFLLRNLSI